MFFFTFLAWEHTVLQFTDFCDPSKKLKKPWILWAPLAKFMTPLEPITTFLLPRDPQVLRCVKWAPNDSPWPPHLVAVPTLPVVWSRGTCFCCTPPVSRSVHPCTNTRLFAEVYTVVSLSRFDQIASGLNLSTGNGGPHTADRFAGEPWFSFQTRHLWFKSGIPHTLRCCINYLRKLSRMPWRPSWAFFPM